MVFSYEVMQHNNDGSCEWCGTYTNRCYAIQNAEFWKGCDIENGRKDVDYYEVKKDGKLIHRAYV
jgi:hypothetical protein